MKTRLEWLSKRFYDSKKFPYGFSRSGVFSVTQSEILESKGNLLQALINNQVIDPDEKDLAFVNAIRHGNINFNLETLVWFKYLNYQRKILSVTDTSLETRITIGSDQLSEIGNIELPVVEWNENELADSELLEAS
ncbi:DUF413 domain-containing protein [Aliikangiella coralliicola]|uniref:Macrodomain Ori protein n=1 Tax=Aliikangiella coralliicola TaxID=2592383 RepID=A0A545U7X1_9GAMM|nr:DUF413 domain-containing protein [Aliikangiella coralliicola]TQV85559.1 DUF413 domain-containing protein [Aliikangiella coralliicola]